MHVPAHRFAQDAPAQGTGLDGSAGRDVRASFSGISSHGPPIAPSDFRFASRIRRPSLPFEPAERHPTFAAAFAPVLYRGPPGSRFRSVQIYAHWSRNIPPRASRIRAILTGRSAPSSPRSPAPGRL